MNTCILSFLVPNRLGMFLPQGLYICYFFCLDNCSLDAYMASSLSSSGLSFPKSPSPEWSFPQMSCLQFQCSPHSWTSQILVPCFFFFFPKCYVWLLIFVFLVVSLYPTRMKASWGQKYLTVLFTTMSLSKAMPGTYLKSFVKWLNGWKLSAYMIQNHGSNAPV